MKPPLVTAGRETRVGRFDSAPRFLRQTLGVAHDGWCMCGGVPDSVQESLSYCRMRGEAIVDPQAAFVGFDHSCLSKICEVPRRPRLGNAEAVVDVTHADLAMAQQSDHAQPRRIGQGF